jgi:hypothetical protein
MTDDVRVLYIGGVGRSGSTLLERMLASLDGFVAIGELVHLNDRGLVENQMCGCGQHFADCPFWIEVGQRAFGGWDQVDGEAQHRLRRSIDRNRYLLRLMAPRGAARRSLDEYTAYVEAIYHAAAAVAGVRVVVDSSKHPSTAFMLRHLRRTDLRIVQMVRRPHGVAHSWMQSGARPEITDRVELMPQYSAARIALRWNIWNLLIALVARFGVPVRVLRYEDLVADPTAVLRDLVAFAGVAVDDAVLVAMRESVDVSRPLHSVAGNPMRFERGAIRVRSDDRWRSAMTSRNRVVVTALTWPLRWWYGYGGPLRRRFMGGEHR